MPPADTFEVLMTRLREGDPVARTEVVERFTNQLIGLARRHLDGRVRQVVEPEDVMDSVYRTFFRRQAQGEFTFDGWGGLWSLLACITVRKCARWRRHVRPEIPLDVAASEYGVPPEYLAREPSPVEAAVLAELVESLLSGLEERDRVIVSLRLQSYSSREIATQLGRSQRTIHRVLDRVKRRLRRLSDQYPGEMEN
jgi:RNA polymerase sigma-70 factor (ECF subfamily)